MHLEKHSAAGNSQVDYAVLSTKLDQVIKLIGATNESGTGGTGLAGELARSNHNSGQRFASIEAKVGHLYSLKHIGVGILIAVGGLATLIMAGVKTTVASWLR